MHALLLAMTAAFHSQGQTHAFRYDPAEANAQGLQVRFESGAKGVLPARIVVGTIDRAGLAQLLPPGARIETAPFAADVQLVTLTSPAEALAAANALYGRPGIRFAHPDFRFEIEARSVLEPHGEPLFDAQWHLAKTEVPAAWARTTGSPSTLVAVIDLGFEQAHPDLQAAWYVNPREVAGNRRDDDGNGYIDDVSGWNFAINGTNLVYGQSAAHGTCTSGLIGARVNGQGVAGLCPDCRVLPLVIDEAVSNAAAAFHYARTAGAAVISNSWGYRVGTPQTDVVVEAIDRAAREGRGGKGTTIVFAVSNFHKDECRGPEPDISSLASVVAVSSVDKDDKKVAEAGYGPCLDIVAPTSASQEGALATTDRPGIKGYNTGERTTDFQDQDYTNTFYGTSAAAPQVAGAFALLYSARPELTREAALDVVLRSADKVRPEDAAYDPMTGQSREYGYGRLNVGRALAP